MKKNYYKVYTILFFVLLSFPAFYTFMKQPELFKDNLPTNLCLTDINDSQNTIANNLSTKDVSMEIAAVINYKLFREPITSQVFFGNNNNFFYAGDQAVDDLTGNYTISDEKLSRICYTQQAIYEELERNGVKYLLVIAPNKETVYPDLLFNKHKNETSEKRKDQIIDALKKNTDVEILDLTEVSDDTLKSA